MEDVIAPISKELLKAELTEEKRLRMTNRSHNQIYIITAQDSPNTMKEIGRLREIAFRAAGGGTGKSMDIDEYDIMDNPYKQLIVWNPEAEEILGGYRYILGTDVRFDEHGAPILATAHMFNFSDKFLKDYLPTTIELGRSFVTLEYQSTRADSKGLFALDNRVGATLTLFPVLDSHAIVYHILDIATVFGQSQSFSFCIIFHSLHFVYREDRYIN